MPSCWECFTAHTSCQAAVIVSVKHDREDTDRSIIWKKKVTLCGVPSSQITCWSYIWQLKKTEIMIWKESFFQKERHFHQLRQFNCGCAVGGGPVTSAEQTEKSSRVGWICPLNSKWKSDHVGLFSAISVSVLAHIIWPGRIDFSSITPTLTLIKMSQVAVMPVAGSRPDGCFSLPWWILADQEPLTDGSSL